jgi:hypothetical protein
MGRREKTCGRERKSPSPSELGEGFGVREVKGFG